MKMWEIARRGLKGRKKDTLLLKLVITLSFVFIITSTIFEASIDRTKLEQRLDLYGEWHAAYLGANEDIVEKLQSESDIDKVGSSLIIGESEKCGVIGTFNQDLIDMGRFSLYKGRYPEADNEIMLELNQMSNMNLDLEVGQKIQVAIAIPRVDADPSEYIRKLNKEFYERSKETPRATFQIELDDIYEELEILYFSNPEDEKEIQEKEARIRELERKRNSIIDRHYNELQSGRPSYHNHHETPFENVGDVILVVSNNYFYYYYSGDEVNPDIIREKGFLTKQNIVMKREMVVTGILQTYTDKWNLSEYKSPNAFLTEEGGKAFTNAFYNNTLGDFSDYEMDYNVFLTSDTYKADLYSKLSSSYSDKDIPTEELEKKVVIDPWFWIQMFGATDEQIDERLESIGNWTVKGRPEITMDNFLEGAGLRDNKMEVNKSNFRRNTFSYPEDSVSTEYVLTLTIIAVIFIATALAIFQIFLTQMKRRSRKIVLLKSMGATNFQIVKILLCEGLLLLRTGLLFGVPIGFGFAAIIIYGMNIIGGRNLTLHVIPSLLVLGIVAGCVALFIGMTVPMIIAIRIPLVGTMSKPPKHKKIKHKENEGKEIRRQTFKHINWQYFKLNKGKTLISFGISLITITILLSTVYLCYFSFNKYRTTVLANNQPDYAMETFFGDTTRHIKAVKEELKAIDGIESTDLYKVGQQTFLWYEGIENNKIIENFRNTLPTNLLANHFSSYNESLKDEPEWIKNALYTKIYGIDPKEDIFNSYISMVNEGTIDKEKFAKGEEVILLIPMYNPLDGNTNGKNYGDQEVKNATNENNRMNWLLKNSNIYDTTYSSRFKDYYNKQNDIKPGDKIHLSADLEKIEGDSYIIAHKSNEVTVGGLIYYFPKEGLWPFSNSIASYVVVGSIECMESIYPNSLLGLGNNSFEEIRGMVNTIYPTKYGRTIWYINTNSREKDVAMDAKLLGYANNNGYTLFNYKDSNAQLYQEGFNNAIIIGLLGLTSAAISCIILYNIMVSKLEQDKNRIGILQALGVTREEFSRHYLTIGIAQGIAAIVIANLLLVTVLYFTSMGTIGDFSMTFDRYIKDIFENILWQYPWVLHVVACIVFFIITVVMNYLPGKNITKLYPVENIRSLGR